MVSQTKPFVSDCLKVLDKKINSKMFNDYNGLSDKYFRNFFMNE
jgi:hypothetical protein